MVQCANPNRKPVMPAVRPLALLLLVSALAAQAEEVDLSDKVASGKWLLTYQRTGELKPLHLRRSENGTSYTCIAGDARAKIIDWVSGKGCTVENETFADGIYRLEGECRLKFWKSQAVPVSVELKPESADRFSLRIRARDNALLGYTEDTDGRLQGPCDPPSAGQPEQNHGA